MTETPAEPLVDADVRRVHRLLTLGVIAAVVIAVLSLLLRYCDGDDCCGAPGQEGASAYDIWLSLGNQGTPEEFLDSLRGRDGLPGRDGTSSSAGVATGAVGAMGLTGATGMTGAQGDSAHKIWLLLGNAGTEQDFIDSLRGESGPQGTAGSTGPAGPTGDAGAPGATGPPGADGVQGPPGPDGVQGPPGPVGFGDMGSFWDETTQGDVSVNPGFLADTPYAMTFDHTDGANTHGVSIVDGSKISFSTSGVYNIVFSAQMERSQGGAASNITIWLRVNGADIPWTATDFTMVANSTRVVAAWNFFVPVSCSLSNCDYYEMMWSSESEHASLLAEPSRTSPARPAIPSVILTVNQVY